ncbi:MAG: hypothetical protein C4555_03380 [Dehalococcoidia bacterium]|nr:MAG: hypothetical protein C4555_03380 [Dehalococcoidia bacterium]
MPAPKNHFKWPEKLHVICWKDNLNWKDSEDVAHSWGDLLAADTGLKLHTAGEFDSVDRYRWLGHLKLFDLTVAAAVETRRMLGAEGRFCVRDGGPFAVRIAWVHSRGNSGFIVRGDSHLRTPYDIKPGTRINRLVFFGSQKVVDGLLAWAGVSHDDIIWVDVGSWEENSQAVVEGRSDIAFAYPNTPSVYQAEENPKGLGWLELNAAADPEGARRFRKIDPVFTFAPMHTGVPSAIGHWGVTGINFEQTRADVDPGLVYHLAKWFNENHPRFKDRHPVNRFRTLGTLMEGLRYTFLPCHDGLVSYLKDLGFWSKAHELRQRQNREIVDGYAAAYLECMRMADDSKIWVARESEEWVKFWNDYKKSHLTEIKPFDDLPVATG